MQHDGSEKLRMARKLVDLGVDILEAGFPIASEGDFEAVAAVSREYPWVQVAALARSCTLDVERAAASLKHARRPRIHTFIATSEIHLKYKLKKSQQQVLDDAVGWQWRARPPPCGRRRVFGRGWRPHRARVSGKDIESRGGTRFARTVNIPDTVGYSVPEENGAPIGRIVKALGDCAYCQRALP